MVQQLNQKQSGAIFPYSFARYPRQFLIQRRIPRFGVISAASADSLFLGL